jgi:hypothetical protein
MTKAVVIVLMGIGVSAALLAAVAPAPEVDPASGASALALVGGILLVWRGRRKR